jgi:hypothetical protein
MIAAAHKAAPMPTDAINVSAKGLGMMSLAGWMTSYFIVILPRYPLDDHDASSEHSANPGPPFVVSSICRKIYSFHRVRKRIEMRHCTTNRGSGVPPSARQTGQKRSEGTKFPSALQHGKLRGDSRRPDGTGVVCTTFRRIVRMKARTIEENKHGKHKNNHSLEGVIGN